MSIAIGMGFFCSETFRSIIDFLLCAWLFWISFGCSRYYLVVPDIIWLFQIFFGCSRYYASKSILKAAASAGLRTATSN